MPTGHNLTGVPRKEIKATAVYMIIFLVPFRAHEYYWSHYYCYHASSSSIFGAIWKITCPPPWLSISNAMQNGSVLLNFSDTTLDMAVHLEKTWKYFIAKDCLQTSISLSGILISKSSTLAPGW